MNTKRYKLIHLAAHHPVSDLLNLLTIAYPVKIIIWIPSLMNTKT